MSRVQRFSTIGWKTGMDECPTHSYGVSSTKSRKKLQFMFESFQKVSKKSAVNYY